MAASDAKLIPIKGVAHRVTFPIVDSTGLLISGATALDSEVSKDGGTFVDCTNEAIEIATSSGVYYLDLTASEMNADTVVVLTKTSSANARPNPIILTPNVDGLVDAIWDELLTGNAHNVQNSAGKRLRLASGDFVISGTAAGGTATTITLDSSASSVSGTYDPALVRITAGKGAGQTRLILQYTGSTKVAAVDRDWRTAPDATSEYDIVSFANVISLNEGLVTGGGASTVTLNADASAIDNVYAGQVIVLRTGTGQDQSRVISSYNGSTKVATVATPWTVQPVSGTGYMIIPTGRAQVVGINDTVLTDIADAVLKRDWASVTGEASRSLLNALRFLRNKWSVSGATLTVTKEDDTTAAWSAELSTNAAATPVTGSDPS